MSPTIPTVIDYDNYVPREVPVKYQGRSFILREAKGGPVTAYRNFLISGMTLGAGGKPVALRGVASAEPLLISKCLFEIVKDPKTETGTREKALSEADVGQFPNKMQKDLFETLKAISDIGEEGAEKKALVKVLTREDSPIKFADLWAFVDSVQGDEEINGLKLWLKPEETEEELKNAGSGTTAG